MDETRRGRLFRGWRWALPSLVVLVVVGGCMTGPMVKAGAEPEPTQTADRPPSAAGKAEASAAAIATAPQPQHQASAIRESVGKRAAARSLRGRAPVPASASDGPEGAPKSPRAGRWFGWWWLLLLALAAIVAWRVLRRRQAGQ